MLSIGFCGERALCKRVCLPLNCKLSLPPPPTPWSLSPLPPVSTPFFPALRPLSASTNISSYLQLHAGCSPLGAPQVRWVWRRWVPVLRDTKDR